MTHRKRQNWLRSIYFVLKNLPWKSIITILVGVLFLAFFTQQWILGYASLHWQTTQGKVIISEAVACRRKYLPDDYQARIVYEYSVDQALYVSNNIIFTTDSFITYCGDAEKVMALYPVGKPVLVYYNPAKPENAVLQPGGTSIMTIAFSAVIVIIGINSLVSNNISARAKRRKQKSRDKIPVT